MHWRCRVLDTLRVGDRIQSVTRVSDKYLKNGRHFLAWQVEAKRGADTVATVFHSCHRLLCGLEGSEPFRVVNYVSLLNEAMGRTFNDDYKDWKLAGTEAEITARVGEARIAAMGEKLFKETILPELAKRPIK